MNPSWATYDNAIKIMADSMRPWRPSDLYREAFIAVPGHEEPGPREDERFRERLSLRRTQVIKRGPWFALKRWIEPVLTMVTQSDLITIPLNGISVRNAQRETLRRIAHMVVRNPQASNETRTMAALNGFTVEHHIKSYFEERWPNSYRRASNDGHYKKPAPDDFSLVIANRLFTVDVAQSNQRWPIRWQLRKGKMRGARLRIIAFYDETGIVMQGFNWHTDNDCTLRPIERLIVRLNIQKDPNCLDYFRDCLPGPAKKEVNYDGNGHN